MKERVRVIMPNRTVKNWWISNECPASSYGMPVLVDEKNNPYGPADLDPGTIIRMQSNHILAVEGALTAGYIVEAEEIVLDKLSGLPGNDVENKLRA
jgi:hypothetical protein